MRFCFLFLCMLQQLCALLFIMVLSQPSLNGWVLMLRSTGEETPKLFRAFSLSPWRKLPSRCQLLSGPVFVLSRDYQQRGPLSVQLHLFHTGLLITIPPTTAWSAAILVDTTALNNQQHTSGSFRYKLLTWIFADVAQQGQKKISQ